MWSLGKCARDVTQSIMSAFYQFPGRTKAADPDIGDLSQM